MSSLHLVDNNERRHFDLRYSFSLAWVAHLRSNPNADKESFRAGFLASCKALTPELAQ